MIKIWGQHSYKEPLSNKLKDSLPDNSTHAFEMNLEPDHALCHTPDV